MRGKIRFRRVPKLLVYFYADFLPGPIDERPPTRIREATPLAGILRRLAYFPP